MLSRTFPIPLIRNNVVPVRFDPLLRHNEASPDCASGDAVW